MNLMYKGCALLLKLKPFETISFADKIATEFQPELDMKLIMLIK